MIWALLFILLSGSGDSSLQAVLDQASARMANVIDDKARREQLEALFESARRATSEFEDARSGDFDEWVKLSKQGARAESGAYASVFRSIGEDARNYQSAMIAHRMQLRDALSRDEWNALFPVEP